MEDLIRKFLSVSYGDGYGDGDGTGDGTGYGYGSGTGDGTGYGDGDGTGYGDGDGTGYGTGYGYGSGSDYGDGDGYGYGTGTGYGDGDGIKSYNGQKVYIIDNIQTLIDSVHGNYAKCRTIKDDLTTEECFVAKCGNFFAHGKTLKEALADAQEKYNENRPLEERIADFIKQYPSLDSIAEHKDLYSWHHILTGSCTFGRDSFARDHNLDKNSGTMTIREFISLTKNAYGSSIIKQLWDSYE